MNDKRKSKAVRIVLILSLFTAVGGAFLGVKLFEGPAFVGIFFGVILGFFAPWVLALLLYTFVALSTPTLGFGDEIARQKRKRDGE